MYSPQRVDPGRSAVGPSSRTGPRLGQRRHIFGQFRTKRMMENVEFLDCLGEQAAASSKNTSLPHALISCVLQCCSMRHHHNTHQPVVTYSARSLCKRKLKCLSTGTIWISCLDQHTYWPKQRLPGSSGSNCTAEYCSTARQRLEPSRGCHSPKTILWHSYTVCDCVQDGHLHRIFHSFTVQLRRVVASCSEFHTFTWLGGQD